MPTFGQPMQRTVALWRGDDGPPVVWPFGETAPPDFFEAATFLLIVQWAVRPAGGMVAACSASGIGEFTRSSEGGGLIVDVAERTVSWSPTHAEFAAFPRGMAPRYELKRIVAGRVVTEFWGELRLASGLLQNPGETPGPIGQGYTDIEVASLRSELLAAIAAIEPGGASGNGGDQTLTFVAVQTIAGHRVARGVPGGIAVCGIADIANADTAIGITEGAALAGASAIVRYGGLLTDTTWAWTEGPVFVGPDGLLTQAPPRAAYEQRVGTAISATQLVVDIEPAFIFAT